jgi:hypothetical protein
MKNVITRIDYQHLRNEVHVQLHVTVDPLFVQFPPDFLGVRRQYDIYKPLVGEETSLLDIVKKSGYTVEIEEQDQCRDTVFRGFADAIKSAENHFNPLKQDAAKRISIVLERYGNIAVKSLDGETAAIDDMLRELRSGEYPALVTVLDLDDWLIQLDTENQRFQELMLARYKETAKLPTANMREVRKKVDKAFLDIIYTIEAQVLISGGMAQYEPFIRELNAIIERYNKLYIRQTNRKKSNE